MKNVVPKSWTTLQEYGGRRWSNLRPPSWAANVPKSITLQGGQSFNFSPYAVDPLGAGLTYSLTGQTYPELVINAVTGLLQCAQGAGAAVRNITVRITAANLTADTPCAVTIQVVQPPATDQLLYEDFSSPTWNTKWHNSYKVKQNTPPYTYALNTDGSRVLRIDPSYVGQGYAPLTPSSYACRIYVPANQNTGTNLSFFPYFPDGNPGGTPNVMNRYPREMTLEYYIRFGSTWKTTQNGKLPGFSSLGDAGYGGSGSNGNNGWSARGKSAEPCTPGSTTDRVSIGSYVYHADMVGSYGESMPWTNCSSGLLRNQWYKLKYYCKTNTGLNYNGVLRAWINDVQVKERTNWRFDFYGNFPLARVWFNIYHGGTQVPTQDIHLFVTNIKITGS